MAVVEVEGTTGPMRSRLRLLPIGAAREDVNLPTPVTTPAARIERERLVRNAAEAASRTKSDLVASVSHELRTPTGCILGLADLVLATELTAEQREHLSLLRASAKGLLDVLNGLLDLAKIEAGRTGPEVMSFSLRALLDETVRPLALAAGGGHVEVHTHVAADMPDRLLGPAGGLRQIVTNLVANALRFTREGTVTVRVEAERQPTSTLLLRLDVRDTGVGIPADKLAAIFQPFEQAAPDDGGTGLGLAISRQLATLMGGRIEVESSEGAGSTFRLIAPFGIEADHDGMGLPAVEPPAAHHRSLRVLFADDHPVSRSFVDALLRRSGHRVTLAADGRQALERFAHDRFDVIVMDGHMPNLDGFETTRAIRAHERATNAAPTPIVALTARAMSDDRQRFLAAGFDAYLSKPVEGDEMLRVLRAIAPAAAGAGEVIASPAPPVDVQRLLRLVRGDGELARGLVDDVVAAAPADLTQLRTALASEDTAGVLRSVHRLQGALAQIAAGPAVETLARVPALHGAGARRMLDSLLAELESGIRELPRSVELSPAGLAGAE